MQSENPPTKFPIPWANGAGSAYIRPVPVASQANTTPGAASLTDGFPPLNSVPIAAGGIPPFMQDFNGIFNLITGWLRWYQAGAPIIYDSAFQSAIGGYPNGARVLSQTVPGRVWQSAIDNNGSNPDTGGGGWAITDTGRLVNIRSFLTTGTYTYSPIAGIVFIIVTVVGGGGAGGGTPSSFTYSVGSGGASGSVGKSLLRTGFSGVAVVVGGGGIPALSNWGGTGGTSSFGSLLSAPGGVGGENWTTNTPTANAGQGLPGAVAVGGNIFNAAGQPGTCGVILDTGPMSGQGGSSILGGGGGPNTAYGAGNQATAPGAGGGGSAVATTAFAPGPYAGGAGAQGAVIIEEYA